MVVEPEDLPLISEQIPEETEEQQEDEFESEEVKSEEQIRQENEVIDTYSTRVNRLTNFYVQAQQLFYNGEFEDALFLIEEAEKIQSNADVLAMKGNIYFGLRDFDEFENYWRQALEMDESVPTPLIPVIVRELQNRGLLDENLKKNF